MPRKFVIIATQRTGTTWLRTLLDSHPAIDCFGEVLNLNDVTDASYPKYVRQKVFGRLRHWVGRGRLLQAYLDQLLDQGPEHAAGFKLMYSMTQWYPYQFPMVMRYVERRNLAVIHLTRRNVLRTHFSRVSARASKVWHTDQSLGEQPPVHMPVHNLLGALELLVEQDARWQQRLAPIDPLSIAYEDLVEDFPRVSKSILSFLGVDSEARLQSSLKKITGSDIGQALDNFGEVRSTLIGTPFEKMLDAHS